MFDIGWQELFIVGLITIVVVGPKELPRVLRTATLWIRKIKGMARDFQDGLEDLAREADLDDMKKELEASADFDLEGELERNIDPGGEMSDAVRELGETVETDPEIKPEPEPAISGEEAPYTKPSAGKTDDAA
jgi:sec-independent protein translocase protein TatB